MIQTKTAIICDAPSQKESIVKMEIRPLPPQEDGQKFLRIDWDLSDTQSAIFSKEVFWTNEEIDQMESYLEANYDFSGLTRTEKEYKKLQLALLKTITETNLLVSGKTYYGRLPSDWEFTPPPPFPIE